MNKNILIVLFCFSDCLAIDNENYYKIDTLEIARWSEYKALVLEAVEKEPYAFLGTSEEILLISETEWCERLKKDDSCILFAFHNNVLIGTASLLVDKHVKLRHVAQVISVYVTPNYRGMGIGRKLIQTLIEKAKSYSFIELLLLQVTTTQTAAITLYESLGFNKESIMPKVIKTDGIYKDQYIMIKYLRE